MSTPASPEASPIAAHPASRGRERGSSYGGYLNTAMDSMWLLANTTSWEGLARELESGHPGVVAAIALSSSLLCCSTLLCLCILRVRLLRLNRQLEERLRLVTAGQELKAFDDERFDPDL